MSDVSRPVRVALVMRRITLGISQRELAPKMGISQSALPFHENASGDDSKVSTFKRWAEALGGTLHMSVTFDDEQAAARRLRLFARGGAGPGWDDLSDEDRAYWLTMTRVARGEQ
jgi:DNA-binding XRE family transcriptional regulator